MLFMVCPLFMLFLGLTVRIFPVPQQLQGYAADSAFAFDAVDPAEKDSATKRRPCKCACLADCRTSGLSVHNLLIILNIFYLLE